MTKFWIASFIRFWLDLIFQRMKTLFLACLNIEGENYMTIEEYAARQSAYARQEERVETIKGLVKLNFTKEQIIDFLTQNLNLSQQEADNAYNQAMATA